MANAFWVETAPSTAERAASVIDQMNELWGACVRYGAKPPNMVIIAGGHLRRVHARVRRRGRTCLRAHYVFSAGSPWRELADLNLRLVPGP